MTAVVTQPSNRYRVRHVMRAEVEKLLTLRSTFWMLLISATGAGLVTFLTTHGALHHDPGWYQGFDPTQESLIGLLVPALVLGVFGALMVTSEYASGSIRTTLAATPRRPVLFAAKFGVAALALLGVGEILSFGCFWLGQAVLSGGGAPSASLGSHGALGAVLMSGVCVAALALIAFGFGLILRSTGGALGAFAGVAFVLPLILKAMQGDDYRYSPSLILTNSVMASFNQGNRLGSDHRVGAHARLRCCRGDHRCASCSCGGTVEHYRR